MTPPVEPPADPMPENMGSWSVDSLASLRKSQRIAWIVAIAGGSIALLEGLALAFLAPLKTVVPYTITVDRQTGYVETARQLQPGALSQNSAITQSFLVQYVLARETFDATDLTENYRKTMLLSTGAARTQYERDMRRANPDSPLNLYPSSTVLQTQIKSVSLMGPDTALVRFETVRREAGADSGERRAWTAVMAFRFTEAAMSMDDRFQNPLGFQVVRYRRDADTAPGSSDAAPLASAAGLQ